MCGVAAWAESWVVGGGGRGGVRYAGRAEPTEILWTPTDSDEGPGTDHLTTAARLIPLHPSMPISPSAPHTITKNRPERLHAPW